jgi:hypothetical protein
MPSVREGAAVFKREGNCSFHTSEEEAMNVSQTNPLLGRSRYHHILIFVSDLAAEDAELIVPSRVEGFIEGKIRFSGLSGMQGQFHQYVFDTLFPLSERDVTGIVMLTKAKEMWRANLCY